MQILITVALAVTVLYGWLAPAAYQAPPLGENLWHSQADPAKEIEFFSGEVTDITPDRIEVTRVVLGKNESRRFAVNDETKFEGTPKKGNRVTVGYHEKAPDTATRIIVRDDA